MYVLRTVENSNNNSIGYWRLPSPAWRQINCLMLTDTRLIIESVAYINFEIGSNDVVQTSSFS